MAAECEFSGKKDTYDNHYYINLSSFCNKTKTIEIPLLIRALLIGREKNSVCSEMKLLALIPDFLDLF